MSAPPTSSGEKITDKRQLVDYLAAGSKPPEAWRIGTEHEKFVFRRRDLRRAPYDGPDGIRALLEGLTRFGWVPVLEAGKEGLIGADEIGGIVGRELERRDEGGHGDFDPALDTPAGSK